VQVASRGRIRAHGDRLPLRFAVPFTHRPCVARSAWCSAIEVLGGSPVAGAGLLA
jgi:hypothetical protein